MVFAPVGLWRLAVLSRAHPRARVLISIWLPFVHRWWTGACRLRSAIAVSLMCVHVCVRCDRASVLCWRAVAFLAFALLHVVCVPASGAHLAVRLSRADFCVSCPAAVDGCGACARRGGELSVAARVRVCGRGGRGCDVLFVLGVCCFPLCAPSHIFCFACVCAACVPLCTGCGCGDWRCRPNWPPR